MKRTNHEVLNSAVNHLYLAALELKTLRYGVNDLAYRDHDLLEQIENGVDKLVKSLQIVRKEQATSHAKTNRILKFLGF